MRPNETELAPEPVSGLQRLVPSPLRLAIAQLPSTVHVREAAGLPRDLRELATSASDHDLRLLGDQVTSCRQEALNAQAEATAATADQYLRYSYQHGIDLLIFNGEQVTPEALENILKFSARLTVVAPVASDIPDRLLHMAEDVRPTKLGPAAVLLSPFLNRIFPINEQQSFPNLDPLLARNDTRGKSHEIDLTIAYDDHLAATVQIRDLVIQPQPPLEDVPSLTVFVDRSEEFATDTFVHVLFASRDSYTEKLRVATSALATIEDPAYLALQVLEEMSDDQLTAREDAVAGSIRATNWVTNEPARARIDVLPLPEHILTAQTIQYRALDGLLPAIHTSLEAARAVGNTARAAFLESQWLEISQCLHDFSDVPERMRRLEDRGPHTTLDTAERYLLFFGRLTHYSNESTERAFERQARLLTVVNRLSNLDIQLQYRIFTNPTRSGFLAPIVEVVCTIGGCSEIEAASLRRSFGELVHTAFVGIYGLSFTFEMPSTGSDAFRTLSTVPRYQSYVVPTATDAQSSVALQSFPDWAFVVDYMCAMDRPVSLELTVKAGGPSADRHTSHPQDGSAAVADHTLEKMLSRVASRVGATNQIVNLSIRLASDDPLPDPLLQMVCAEIGSQGKFEPEDSGKPIAMPVGLVDSLRVFHPPFGHWYGGDVGINDLAIPAPIDEFPFTGVPLGRATLYRAKANTAINVRLPDLDRLRHVYVIGKTGSGKTNLLRGLVEAELANPSVGLAVIDPHGDLAGHLVNLLPKSRLPDIQLVDLSDPDLTPVLNPLLIDRTDRLARSRVVQDVLSILKLRVFHEFSGPRFDEIVRLLLDTMLDPGYPETPSLIDAGLLLTNEPIQRSVRLNLKDDELKERWRFHDKLKDGREYYDLLDWVVSKFDSFQHDATLRCVLGGESNTTDIDLVVNTNGVLVVSLPESVVGRDTGELIGSLVLLQLKTALLRRVPAMQEPFFVYIDEFQKFAGVGFEELLAEARKFGVGLTMAHQNMEQLRSFSQHTGHSTHSLINSILGNVGTIVVFPVGSQDAEVLSNQVGLSSADLSRIARYEAVVRMTVDGHQLPAFTVQSQYAEPGLDPRNLDDIREYLVRSARVQKRGDVLRKVDERRARLGLDENDGSSRQSESVKELATTSERSAFLDEWLAKRRKVSTPADDGGLAKPVSAETSPLDRTTEEYRRREGDRVISSSWAQVVGPVVRLEDVAQSLERTLPKLRSDARHHRLLILTTREGTEVVPANHFAEGSLVPSLADVIEQLRLAPFSEWTKAAWLASPHHALGGLSPLAWAKDPGNPSEVLVHLARAYAEELG